MEQDKTRALVTSDDRLSPTKDTEDELSTSSAGKKGEHIATEQARHEKEDKVKAKVLSEVSLDGSHEDSNPEKAENNTSVTNQEPKSAQKKNGREGDGEGLSPTASEDGQLSPTSLQAKYDLLSKAGVRLEGDDGSDDGGGGVRGDDSIDQYSEALMTPEAEDEEKKEKEPYVDEVSEALGNSERAAGSLKRVRFADEVSRELTGNQATGRSAEQEMSQLNKQEQLIKEEEEVRKL